MRRAKGEADLKLIEAAVDLIPRGGVSELRVREVAARAGVNLGMFHYHFGSKREFSRRVLQEMYERFFSRLTDAAGPREGDPVERLRRTVRAGARFVRENRALVLALGRDLLADNREVIEFARANFPRHIRVLIGIVRDCRKAGKIARRPLVEILPFLFASVMGPIMASVILAKVLPAGLREISPAVLGRFLDSDAAVDRRISMALRALAKGARE